MPEYNVILPSKPRVISEDAISGVYEIDGLYPGYGHTLGNSLRRIILSSLPGAAITSVKIDGVAHEFSTIHGIKEDVITILLNLKKVRFKILTDEAQVVTLFIKGAKTVTAEDLKVPGQVEVLSKDAHIATITDKNAALSVELTIEKGLGYLAKEALKKKKVDIGMIAVDAIFTPIRRVNYEVENMRVGERTDHNRLKISIETDGTLTAREALEKSIEIMLSQLKAIIGFKEEEIVIPEEIKSNSEESKKTGDDSETAKTKIETLSLSTRTINALNAANIRTVSGLYRKREADLLALDGLGNKGIQEIKRALGDLGIVLKDK